MKETKKQLLASAGTVTERLAALGIEVPEAPAAVAAYLPAKISGNYLYTSGQLPFTSGQLLCTGQVTSRSLEEAVDAARQCAVNALAAAKSVLGDLNRVTSVVKVVGFVSSGGDFTDQPAVINGASDLIVQVFGDRGKHARSAVGVASLPLNASVEIEAVMEFE